MNRRQFVQTLTATLAGMLFFSRPVRADKSSVRIEVPETAVPGREITIRLHVSHDGNNFFHHTDWVYVSVNGKEIKRWEFGIFDTPESDNFQREIRYTVAGPVTITAEASCNLHGSNGIAEKKITVP